MKKIVFMLQEKDCSRKKMSLVVLALSKIQEQADF